MRRVKGQPFPLGVTNKQGIVNFSVAIPKGKSAKLLLYTEQSAEPVEMIELDSAIGEVRCAALADMDESVLFYNYQIDGQVMTDPYVKKLSGKSMWGEFDDADSHKVRGYILMDPYDWEDDKLLQIPYEEVIAYTLHVRGYTKDKNSGVQAKGTFEGIVEKIPYLKELGINQVQCMPIYEFDECKEPINYWGYGPGYYFSPKNAYSATGNGILSFKNMVKALHASGIEVVLEMPFEENISKQLMIDCLRYYVMEYHVDGFICNPSVAPMEVITSDPYLKDAKIMRHQTDFKDTMRRFLKGDGGQIMAVKYWINHLSEQDRIFNYITSHSGFTMNDLVSYNEKHNEVNHEHNRDGMDCNNSWNCGTEGPTQYDEIAALRKSQVRNAFLLLMLSQGIPCILAGDEWGNTQYGNNNVYCQDNEVGWINWERFPRNHTLFEFVKELISFRKKFKLFTEKEEFSGRDMNNCGIPDVSYHGEDAWRASFDWESRQLGVYYHEEDADEDIYIAYNMHWEQHEFALPKLPGGKKWSMAASTKEGVIDAPVILIDQQRQAVMPRMIIVFEGQKVYGT